VNQSRGYDRGHPRYVGSRPENRWGKCVAAFDEVISHANGHPGTNVLLASGTPLGFSNMHRSCEYYLPQAGARRVNGVWNFPNGARLRVAKIQDQVAADKLLPLDFSLICVQAEGDTIALLRPLLTLDGRIIPFLGHY
jgi:hypothetical protein